MIEAFDAVEAVLWGAIAAFAVIATGIAFLTVAASYWTAVLAVWAIRTITHHIRKETPQP
ncbi:hypothetical protein [Streptomyces acidicola]|uniref:Uncharacterized protein n=1 Tax=Streptomyces acidicola TaxID=2596892 RepID=A0A5N8WKR7_9ACTN|nr:hypothetical protein [Streptomyces acidicola]MPY47078.1 hypothetical protein [Streptomyces acidicola]MPY47217.1 hypothetical protein [Streptomyces acidicola]